MSRPDLSAIRERLERIDLPWSATDGEEVRDARGRTVKADGRDHLYNFDLILNAPTDLAALLEYVGELEGQVERAGLAACQHRFEVNHGMYDSTHRYCTICGRAE